MPPVYVFAKLAFAERDLERHVPAHAGAHIVEGNCREFFKRRKPLEFLLTSDVLGSGLCLCRRPMAESVFDKDIGVRPRQLAAVRARHFRVVEAVDEALKPMPIVGPGILNRERDKVTARRLEALVAGQAVIELRVRNLNEANRLLLQEFESSICRAGIDDDDLELAVELLAPYQLQDFRELRAGIPRQDHQGELGSAPRRIHD